MSSSKLAQRVPKADKPEAKYSKGITIFAVSAAVCLAGLLAIERYRPGQLGSSIVNDDAASNEGLGISRGDHVIANRGGSDVRMSTLPPVVDPSEGTLQALTRMRDAYEQRDLVRLLALRHEAERMVQWDNSIALGYLAETICARNNRWDHAPTLERSIGEAIVHHMNQDGTSAIGQADMWAFETLTRNQFLEFAGKWATNPGAEAKSVEYQVAHFVRPLRCADSEAVFGLLAQGIELGLASGAQVRELRSASLLRTVRSPVEDRLGYFQVRVCGLIADNKLRQHIPDLEYAFRSALVPDVRVAALLALATLSGQMPIEIALSKWRELATKGEYKCLESDIASFLRQVEPLDEGLSCITLLLEDMETLGLNWDNIRYGPMFGLADRLSKDPDARASAAAWVRRALTATVSLPEFVVWGIVAPHCVWDDNGVASTVRTFAADALRNDNLSVRQLELIMSTTFICLTQMDSSNYASYEALRTLARDAASQNWHVVHKELLNSMFVTPVLSESWVNSNQQVMELMEELTNRALSSPQSTNLRKYAAGWGTMLHPNVRNRLIVLSEQAERAGDTRAVEFYADALVRWQTQYEKATRR